jgi:hypothetical protein
MGSQLASFVDPWAESGPRIVTLDVPRSTSQELHTVWGFWLAGDTFAFAQARIASIPS